jgi:hypothetical protein
VIFSGWTRSKQDVLWNTNAPVWGKFQRRPSSSKLKIKVKMSKFKVPIKKSCHNEHAYKIPKPYHWPFKRYGQCSVFKKYVNVQIQGLRVNKMCYETQMLPYEANSRGGHHRQIPRTRFQNLQLQYKGLVTRNMPMKYKSPITNHSKHMAKAKVFKKWVKLQGQGHKVKNYGTIRKFLS